MTPDRLLQLVATVLPTAEDLSTWSPEHILSRVEEAAEATPGSPALEAIVLEAHTWVTARHGLPPVVAGSRLGELIRWDRWSATFLAEDVRTGQAVMVRTLRDSCRRDPLLRRALMRAGVAARRVQPDLELVAGGSDDALPALRLRLPGDALDAVHAADTAMPLERQARAVVMGLGALQHWNKHGLSPGSIAAAELRIREEGLALCCLTPSEAPDWKACLTTLCSMVRVEDDGPLTIAIEGLRQLPPSDLDEAVALIRNALRNTLLELHLELHTWRAQLRGRSRQQRLAGLCRRLRAASPPPAGRGHVGVDLEGRPTVVVSTCDTVQWGPVDSPTEVVFTTAEGVLPVPARHLMRAHVAAPPNRRLEREVGATSHHTGVLCRWLSAQLRLRTLSLLLERTE